METNKNEKNLEIYNKYAEPPKEALKNFNNGTFSGTDINTMWRIKSLTEQFGVCGIGWYYDIVRTWTEQGENSKETMAFAEIKLYIWNKESNEWSKGISGIGGNKMETYVKSSQYWKISDECFKMAVTDALGNACRNLGFGAKIYWDKDTTKYNNDNEVKSNEKILCTPEQVARMKELKVIEANILTRFKVKSLEELTTAQAEWVIRAKEKSLQEQGV